jgi:hypothetical protein
MQFAAYKETQKGQEPGAGNRMLPLGKASVLLAGVCNIMHLVRAMCHRLSHCNMERRISSTPKGSIAYELFCVLCFWVGEIYVKYAWLSLTRSHVLLVPCSYETARVMHSMLFGQGSQAFSDPAVANKAGQDLVWKTLFVFLR